VREKKAGKEKAVEKEKKSEVQICPKQNTFCKLCSKKIHVTIILVYLMRWRFDDKLPLKLLA
jgi:hypothetical protein